MRSSYIFPPHQDQRQPDTSHCGVRECENITVACVKGLVRPTINFAVNGNSAADRRWVLNAAVRINYRADARVCGTYLVPSILDRPRDTHPQMLKRRRRLAKPAVIRYDHDQLGAQLDDLPDERRENALVAKRV